MIFIPEAICFGVLPFPSPLRDIPAEGGLPPSEEGGGICEVRANDGGREKNISPPVTLFA